MRMGLCLLLSFLLVACQTAEGPLERYGSAIYSGQSVAEKLNARYADTRGNCGSLSKPAFLCSGVILRITTYSPDYDSWDPSPNSIELGGQSFSYLRKDSKFSRLAWHLGNGYILYSIFGAPADKLDPDVLCLFPIDGYSDNRSGERCGIYSDNNASSRPCEDQDITTAEQWLSLYSAQNQSNSRLCSFNVRDDRNILAGPAFYSGLKARSMGAPSDKRFTQHNELVLKTWGSGLGKTLPIEAFFYTDAKGLESAIKDRRNFLGKTGIMLPLIKLNLPSTPAEDAAFEYVPGDDRL